MTVAPLSSNTNNIYPFEAYLPRGLANLNENSKIMIIQLRNIDKKRLLQKIGIIEDQEIILKIDKIISEHFSL